MGCSSGLCPDTSASVRIGVEGGGRPALSLALISACNILVILMTLKEKYNKFVFIG